MKLDSIVKSYLTQCSSLYLLDEKILLTNEKKSEEEERDFSI